MIHLDQIIHLEFTIPPTDALGRELVMGKLRFLPKNAELHWRLADNVFRGGKDELKSVTLPYSQIDAVNLDKKWLRPSKISLHISDPALVADIPGVEMGKITFQIEKNSEAEVKKLKEYIDFKRSIFLFEQHDAYLDEIKSE